MDPTDNPITTPASSIHRAMGDNFFTNATIIVTPIDVYHDAIILFFVAANNPIEYNGASR